MAELYIGLMSGTSIDGIDAGLVDFSDHKITLVEFHYQAFPSELRQSIQTVSQANQAVLLQDYGTLDSRIGRLFGETSNALLAKAGIPANAVTAIGSHGQTVYHAPAGIDGFTLQIGDPNRIAEITGITTVADFRRRDIAAGGQGAPLVPAFHQAVFSDSSQARTVVNIGGIANITVLDDKPAIGFDTGPGNGLLDYWYQQHHSGLFDPGGDWAASGRTNQELLTKLKDDPYFRLAPPKSTGKEYFSAAWLQQKIEAFCELPSQDVQATLCQFSADTISAAIRQHAPGTTQVFICGGGTHNRHLLRLLAENMRLPVASTATIGIDPDHVEAIAFAWLARQTLNGLPGNLCSVTGAKVPVILGGIYPGGPGLS
ncbi:anhydro-N-acetylmuramic acid kinase [Methylomonas koyamae]|uniref:Anhydro-N-acetylmuramic acid kinase n=1 Tax=Methylomonas koyamae TaxID=702114 RepID=A0A291IFB9_9GAMM|nr:anhydro-N-acetylmuramic acid kinase [Methylomonas koyamae]ATG89034.1 anhydro-N-acetylmuramic acid kinase [Methylomonas koyamae]OAI28623.1 anhydro-N-acetylmuramic acid kinase [Methylomonas koyamae]